MLRPTLSASSRLRRPWAERAGRRVARLRWGINWAWLRRRASSGGGAGPGEVGGAIGEECDVDRKHSGQAIGILVVTHGKQACTITPYGREKRLMCQGIPGPDHVPELAILGNSLTSQNTPLTGRIDNELRGARH